jgi:two-component sensor histidine kinase
VLYEQLFRADTEDRASLNEYVSTLVRQVLSVFPPVPGLELVVRGPDADDCVLDAARLPTIGLIVNELITNAMKYAFPPAVAHGLLEVELNYTDERVELSVADNGPGIPNSVVSRPQSGFGLGMVNALVEQLHGQMRIESNSEEAGGTRVTFSFPR